MKTIGIIGGMSWESTVTYYKRINEIIRERLGGLHSAKMVIASVEFHEVEALQRQNDWEAAGRILARCAQGLEAAGAECIVIGANTMHLCAAQVEAAVNIPLLHIADATAGAAKRVGVRRAALLGTRYTMEKDFLKSRLKACGLDVLVPEADDRAEINRIIYEELCCGRVLDASRETFRRIIAKLAAAGAEGVILGCTEIDLIVRPEDSPVPVIDTTEAHAEAAAAFCLETPF